jgi:hypothetical protein
MGAIPWVVMQVILVAIVIFVPQTVTMFLPKEVKVDTSTIQIEVPDNELQPADESNGENPFGDAPADAQADTPADAPAPEAAKP